MEHEKKWAIASLASIPLVMTLGNSMLIPVLPTIEKKLKISSFQVSMIITVYSIVAIILIPIAGYLSDRLGRKAVIIPSLIITAIGGVISGWAGWKMDDPYWIILLGRTLQGVGAAGAAPIVMPLVGDMFKSDTEVSKNLGIIETSNTLGKVLSPILGAVLAGFVWFLPFFSIPIFCLVSILLMIFLVKSPKKEEEPLPFKEFLQAVKAIFKKDCKWLLAIFFIGCVLMFVLFGVLFYLSDLLEKKHQIDGIKKGLFLAVPLASLCIASFLTGKKIEKNKVLMKWLIVISIGVLGGAVFANSFFSNVWVTMGLFLIGGIGIGVALPSLDALITEGIEKEERGTITSIYSSMRFIGVALGPPIVALLIKRSDNMMFYVLAGTCAAALLISFKGIDPPKGEETPPDKC
ncbi:ACDE family multidrug resistance protein [Bacillus tianshenii]|uniref:ACDE family multidrug resistance protein n=1 Tax=Sutcliffiella tianshenii TaxID=1463404 RepID=A0ABS2P755_9BACI|nr:MFS transporter [Bacillus tianshenii]MBM7622235.1 ACDE family multidrug resistance protein [Bacillus tianshenii]